MRRPLNVGTFNALADTYTDYGNYSHVDLALLDPGARTKLLIDYISSLDLD